MKYAIIDVATTPREVALATFYDASDRAKFLAAHAPKARAIDYASARKLRTYRPSSVTLADEVLDIKYIVAPVVL